jgi:hypothetical protein
MPAVVGVARDPVGGLPALLSWCAFGRGRPHGVSRAERSEPVLRRILPTIVPAVPAVPVRAGILDARARAARARPASARPARARRPDRCHARQYQQQRAEAENETGCGGNRADPDNSRWSYRRRANMRRRQADRLTHERRQHAGHENDCPSHDEGDRDVHTSCRRRPRIHGPTLACSSRPRNQYGLKCPLQGPSQC